MLPDKSRKEWAGLITGEVKHKFSSFALQMKINHLSRQFAGGMIELDKGVDDFYDICSKYQLAAKADIAEIFGL